MAVGKSSGSYKDFINGFPHLLGDGEAFGMVIAESMPRSVPILASNLSAFVEVFGDAGHTFKTGDPAGLVHQIVQLLDGRAAPQYLELAAQQRARASFALRRMIEGQAQIYKRFAPNKVA